METKEPWFMKTGQDSWVIVAGRVKTLPSPNYYPTFIGDSVGGEGRGGRQGDGFNQFAGLVQQRIGITLRLFQSFGG
jgi:hypothetical protein